MCSFKCVIVKVLTLRVFDVRVFMFYVSFCRDWFCGLIRERVNIWKEFSDVHLLLREFDCPEVPMCVDRTLKCS